MHKGINKNKYPNMMTNGQAYQLAERMKFDYNLSIQDDKGMVTQSDFRDGKPLLTGDLHLLNGEIAGFGNENKSYR